MKKIFAFLLLAICFSFTACDSDEWGNGDPAMEHIYYFGFENWGQTTGDFNNNKVEYKVKQGETVKVPVQFHSERTRSYDVTVYYYISSADTLNIGRDYEIVDSSGTTLTPDADGGFKMEFPKAEKGVKGIYVKTLSSGKKGAFSLYTFNPTSGEISHPDNNTNSQTKDYEVRAFTRNYKVKVLVE